MSETPAITEEQVATASRPSSPRITDLRVANVTGVPFRSSITRIDTNQGVCGFGDIDEERLRRHLDPRDPVFFAETTHWDVESSHDRLWSQAFPCSARHRSYSGRACSDSG